jgi:hypothetical protein
MHDTAVVRKWSYMYNAGYTGGEKRWHAMQDTTVVRKWSHAKQHTAAGKSSHILCRKQLFWENGHILRMIQRLWKSAHIPCMIHQESKSGGHMLFRTQLLKWSRARPGHLCAVLVWKISADRRKSSIKKHRKWKVCRLRQGRHLLYFFGCLHANAWHRLQRIHLCQKNTL